MTEDMPLLGFGLPVSGSWAQPSTMLRIARRAEELGYASLWTFQRVLYPAAGGLGPAFGAGHSPAARPADDPSYRAVRDPLLPLAYVAGHTERIGLGTATICALFTPPALLAKAMATLDHLCAGRLTVGLGIGWMPQEYAAAGVPFARRGARMDEYLRCLEALWTQDPVEFAGEFYPVPRSHTGLRPVQRPYPPVLLGGAAAPALRRAGRLADRLRIVVRGVVDLVDDDPGPGRRPLHGTREQVLDDLAGLRAHGVTEVFVDLNFLPRVGSPDVDVEAATAEAERVLVALAPGPAPTRPAPSA